MNLTIQLPDRSSVLASNRQHWEDILSDPRWANHPYRIESNAFGQIVMTPPASGSHSARQSEIAFRLRTLLGGRALCECPVSTVDGVRAVDVAWYSDQRYGEVRGQSVHEQAGEICVEVLSPRNSEAEMRFKRKLYFDAGAIECWTCDLEGRMSYHDRGDQDAPIDRSNLCPHFPHVISE